MRRILLGCCNGCWLAGWRTPTPFPRALLEPVPVTHARNAGRARTAAQIPAEHRYVPVLFSAHNLSRRTRTSRHPSPLLPTVRTSNISSDPTCCRALGRHMLPAADGQWRGLLVRNAYEIRCPTHSPSLRSVHRGARKPTPPRPR